MRLLPTCFSAFSAFSALSVFCLAACLSPAPTGDAGGGPEESADPPRYGRELGTLTALYPEPKPDGSFDLEVRFTQDTVLVDYEDLRTYASDSVGRALFHSTREPFYTRDDHCFFSPKKDACLAFRKTAR